jgi:hypothetical protein
VEKGAMSEGLGLRDLINVIEVSFSFLVLVPEVFAEYHVFIVLAQALLPASSEA